jgi:hypothetical protein
MQMGERLQGYCAPKVPQLQAQFSMLRYEDWIHALVGTHHSTIAKTQKELVSLRTPVANSLTKHPRNTYRFPCLVGDVE